MYLWPLYLLAAVMGTYVIVSALRAYFTAAFKPRADHFEDYLRNITPTETPFSRMKDHNND